MELEVQPNRRFRVIVALTAVALGLILGLVKVLFDEHLEPLRQLPGRAYTLALFPLGGALIFGGYFICIRATSIRTNRLGAIVTWLGLVLNILGALGVVFLFKRPSMGY